MHTHVFVYGHQVAGGKAVTLPESLLFVSTLDGSLHAVSKQTGDIKWTLREGLYNREFSFYVICLTVL